MLITIGFVRTFGKVHLGNCSLKVRYQLIHFYPTLYQKFENTLPNNQDTKNHVLCPRRYVNVTFKTSHLRHDRTTLRLINRLQLAGDCLQCLWWIVGLIQNSDILELGSGYEWYLLPRT